MKLRLLLWVAVLLVIGLLFHPSCKSGGCDFSILGTWSLNLNIPGWDVAPPESWTEVLTFSGTETSGTISGWNYSPGEIGSYSVTDCATVQIIYNYIDSFWGSTNVVMNGTLTSASTMNGNGTWEDDYGLVSLTWTANKLM